MDELSPYFQSPQTDEEDNDYPPLEQPIRGIEREAPALDKGKAMDWLTWTVRG